MTYHKIPLFFLTDYTVQYVEYLYEDSVFEVVPNLDSLTNIRVNSARLYLCAIEKHRYQRQ